MDAEEVTEEIGAAEGVELTDEVEIVEVGADSVAREVVLEEVEEFELDCLEVVLTILLIVLEDVAPLRDGLEEQAPNPVTMQSASKLDSKIDKILFNTFFFIRYLLSTAIMLSEYYKYS